ncbi:MAG: TRAP transporter TatT component family protein [Myxococcota bacterium]|nr:TRAP transporter TatT component family protein [Myxococcota bacterium]
MFQRILISMCLALMTFACGGRQNVMVSAKKAVADADVQTAKELASKARELWKEREDESKAKAAIDAWNQAIIADPNRHDVYRDLAYAYYYMNNVFVRWQDDNSDAERKNYLKGVEAAEKALSIANPAFAETILAGGDKDDAWTRALEAATKEDVKALYWYATNLAKWALKDGIGSLLKYKDRAYAIMQRCKALDNSFWYGGPSRYLGAYWLKIPFGKSPEKSKANFEASVNAAPQYLDTKLLMAEIYAVRTDNEALFKRLLNDVLETADDVDQALIPENKNAKRIAKKMLENMDDYF